MTMNVTEHIQRLREETARAEQTLAEWPCPEWTRQAVRHIARNCEIECSHATWDEAGEQWVQHDCPVPGGGWDRYETWRVVHRYANPQAAARALDLLTLLFDEHTAVHLRLTEKDMCHACPAGDWPCGEYKRTKFVIRKQREEHRNTKNPDWAPRWCCACQSCGRAVMHSQWPAILLWAQGHRCPTDRFAAAVENVVAAFRRERTQMDFVLWPPASRSREVIR